MEDKKYYTCKYCYKEFEPKRRRVQIYCSNTCRSKAHHAKKHINAPLAVIPKSDSVVKASDVPPIQTKTKVETMSLAGVGNAAAGNLAADAVKSLLTPIDNKPATKGDLKKLTEKLVNRYHPISNMPQRFDGALPYFDMNTNTMVYLKWPL